MDNLVFQRSLYERQSEFTALLAAGKPLMSRLSPRHWIGFVLIGYAVWFILLPGTGFGGLNYLETELGITPTAAIAFFLLAGVLEWILPIRKPHLMFLGIIPQFVFAVFSWLFTLERYPAIPGAAPWAHFLVSAASVGFLYLWILFGRHDDA